MGAPRRSGEATGPLPDEEAQVPGARCVVGNILEMAIPFASLGLAAGDPVEMVAHLLEGGQPVETMPDTDLIRFVVPDEGFADSMWSA